MFGFLAIGYSFDMRLRVTISLSRAVLWITLAVATADLVERNR